MVSALLSRVVILTAGTLYPAYRSYKAVKTKNVREYVKWMMYWIVFAVFLCVETMADVFLAFWFPFYYELKMLFVIWLLSPYTKGASFLYRKFIHPTLNRHEEEIDLYLDRAKQEGYSAIVRIGSKGINYAKEMVATAAIKGQVQLVNQLKKSYSLNDVSDSTDGAGTGAGGGKLKITSSSGVDAQSGEERVWEGYYDDDDNDNEAGVPIVENEFQYLYEDEQVVQQQGGAGGGIKRSSAAAAVTRVTQDDGGSRVRTRSKRAGHNDVVDAYATMPRRSNRNATGAAATKRAPLPTTTATTTT